MHEAFIARLLPFFAALLLLILLPFVFTGTATTLSSPAAVALHAHQLTRADFPESRTPRPVERIIAQPGSDVRVFRLFPYSFVSFMEQGSSDVLIAVEPSLEIPDGTLILDREGSECRIRGGGRCSYLLFFSSDEESWPVRLFSVISSSHHQ